MTPSFLLFDDARDGGAPCRLYEGPTGEVVAHSHDQVPAALAQLRYMVAGGQHVAGWIGYDAGYALEAKLNEIEDSINIQEEGFRALVKGSKVDLEDLKTKAPSNWYIEAEEARDLGLILDII